ncbi:MAG: galactokinase [Cyanobacteria bacterium RYN_339]|nr:galactokinase [Cyanobacteria bacterium RYN_339]
MSDRVEAVKAAFREKFGGEPDYIVRAPGRVNLIGEHTDYNDGFVFPVAIDREMIIAARPKADRKDFGMRLYSMDYDQLDEFAYNKLEKSAEHPWSDYLRGMLSIWQACAFKVRAFEAVLSGNVPQGAGLSSSAAYEVAVGKLVDEMMASGIPPKQLAMLAQKAENRFIGVQCGIMDQFISALGKADSALLLDCRSLQFRAVPLRLAEQGAAIVITETGVQRGLVDSEYNARRAECAEGVALLAKKLKQTSPKALRDVTFADFKKHEKALPEVVAKRCRHVITENNRVLDSVEALEKGKLEAFGKLMNESHASLRDDYEVSCKELDVLADLTQKHPGVFGARMTGAGFGGCTVAIMKTDAVASYEAKVIPAYEQATGRKARVFVCKAVGGASMLASPMMAAGPS